MSIFPLELNVTEIAGVCLAIQDWSVTALLQLLGDINVNATVIVDLLTCLDIDITSAQVIAILGL